MADVMLGELKLRAVVACVSRASDRVLPLIEQEYTLLCADIRDMAWSFAAGEPASVLELWQIAKLAEVLPEQPEKSVALAGVHLAGLSAQNAYRAVASSPLNRESARDALRSSEAALLLLVQADGSSARNALLHDIRKLQGTHRGDISELGLPINAGPEGELGPLWLEGEQPTWWHSSQERDEAWVEPNVMPIKGVIDAHVVARERPTFVCFFVKGEQGPTNIDDPVLSDVANSLKKLDELSSLMDACPGQSRPGFVVYVTQIDHPTYLRLTLQGALVVTQDKLVGAPPKNLDEFVEAYRESLYQWAHPRVRSGWRRSSPGGDGTIVPAQREMASCDTMPDPDRPDPERLNRLVRNLGTAFPLPEY